MGGHGCALASPKGGIVGSTCLFWAFASSVLRLAPILETRSAIGRPNRFDPSPAVSLEPFRSVSFPEDPNGADGAGKEEGVGCGAKKKQDSQQKDHLWVRLLSQVSCCFLSEEMS